MSMLTLHFSTNRLNSIGQYVHVSFILLSLDHPNHVDAADDLSMSNYFYLISLSIFVIFILSD